MICPNIPGSHILATYSLFIVHGISTLVIIIYSMALLLKFVYMGTALACPMCIVRLKLRYYNLPMDYEHYRGEFDFEAFDEGNK